MIKGKHMALVRVGRDDKQAHVRGIHRIDDLDRKDQDRDRRSLFDLILDHFLL